ncbi:MAG: tetratricopeptide repeat protein [Burkholderiales bacterium]|nr:tetratricopeptide repeat protein [Burkholderiales bacterium]
MRSRLTLAALAACVLIAAGKPVAAQDAKPGATLVKEASALLREGDLAGALERADKAVAANPRDPDARFVRGVVLAELKRTTEAVTAFTLLTQDYPEMAEPYNNLAVIYAAQGEYERARYALEQALRANPAYATAYENLGDVYVALAMQAYQRSLGLDARNNPVKAKLAVAREIAPAGARVKRPEPLPPAAPKPTR